MRGTRRPLHDFKGYSAVVVAFVGTDCPISNLYMPGLVELEKKYRERKVQFLAVYANEGEDLDQVAAHAYDRDVPFPVLKDFGQKLADTLGVTRVPTVALLDGDFVLRYRGRVDDRYRARGSGGVMSADLERALEEIAAGKPVSVERTKPVGCPLQLGPLRTGG